MSNIDQPVFDVPGDLCPKCGDFLIYYPKQSGPCHSGSFIAHMDAEYFCTECEEGFDPGEIETKTA